MIAGLTFLLALGQQKSVVTTAELLQNDELSGRERVVARKHRWILSGSWTEESNRAVQLAALKLAKWRAKDLSLESESGAGESQMQLLANWKSRIKESVASGQPDLKNLILDLKPESFPLAGLTGGKWISIDQSGSTGLSPTSKAIAEKLYSSCERRFARHNIILYILIRKVDTRLLIYFSANDSLGKQIDFEKIAVENALDEPSKSGLDYEFVDPLSARPLKVGDLSEGKNQIRVDVKDFDWTGIAKQSLLTWFQSRYLKTTKPTALLASDVDILKFIRAGGSLEPFFNSLGYRAFECKDVTLVLPPFLAATEDCRLLEKTVANIQPNLDCAVIIDRYAHWVADSELQSDVKVLDYLSGSLSWQRHLPDLHLDLFPLLPSLRDIPIIDRNRQITVNRLIGSRNFLEADRDIHSRIASGFEIPDSFSEAENLGYFFGQGQKEQLLHVQTKIDSVQRIKVLDFLPTAVGNEHFRSNVTFYGDTWPKIEKKLNELPATLVGGDEVTVTFISTLNRKLEASFFFERATLKSGKYKDMPKNLRDDQRQATEEYIKDNDGKITPPPLSAE